MNQSQALADAEERLNALETLPRSLNVLRQAIEIAAGAKSAQVPFKIDGQELRAQWKYVNWSVRVDEAGYRYSSRMAADTGEGHEPSTTKLAWSIVGHPVREAYIKAQAAAAFQRFQKKKNQQRPPQ